MRAKRHRLVRIRTKLVWAFVVLSVVSTGLLSLFLYSYLRNQLLQTFRESLRNQVAIAALQIDGDAHSALQMPADAESAAYQKIRQQLTEMYTVGHGLAFPYTVRFDAQGKVHFIVDSTDPEPAALGEEYPTPGPLLQQGAAAVRSPVVEADLYTDDWGVWLSSYAPILRSDGQQDGVLVLEVSAEQILEQQNSLLLGMLLAFLISLPFAVVLGFWLAYRMTLPLAALREMTLAMAETDLPDLSQSARSIAAGNLTQSSVLAARSLSMENDDEFGEMAGALNEMVQSVQQTNQSLNEMALGLNHLAVNITQDALDLEASSRQLSATSDRVQNDVQSMASDFHQASATIGRQTQLTGSAAASMKEMLNLIDGLTLGARNQSEAARRASSIAAEFIQAVEQVSQNANGVIQHAARAAQLTRQGANIVDETIQRMQTIQTQVLVSTQKVEKMGQHSENIEGILDTIEEISSQTNLLALNAAIETARAETQSEVLIDQVLNHQMIAQAQLLNQILLDRREAFTLAFWADLVRRAGISSLSITNADGVIVYSNEAEVLGWRFPEDPHAQAYEFRKLIGQSNGAVCQKRQQRSSDGKFFKYIGVPRLDEPGIVQIAYNADQLENFKVNLGSFGVVADEVRKLAERSNASSKEIGRLVKDIQKTVAESVTAMNTSAHEVEIGAAQSKEAGAALNHISAAVESVDHQAALASRTADTARTASAELSAAIESVLTVIAENQRMAEEMAARSAETMDMVRQVSAGAQENSAMITHSLSGVESVSAQARALVTAAHTLEEMAGKLRGLVSRFRLSK